MEGMMRFRGFTLIELLDKRMSQNTDTYGQEAPPAGQFLDIQYMAQGWAYEHKL